MRCLWLALLLISAPAFADEPLTVAVASNFLGTAERITERFTRDTGIPVRLSSGSTGKLYAQIVNGAPYDVFLAADEERPRLLAENNLALDGNRFTYAFGQLRLLASNAAVGRDVCEGGVLAADFDKIAIANPMTAPYGRAAKEYLQNAGIWEAVKSRVVYGENVAQVRQFVDTGNAQVGLGAAFGLPKIGYLSVDCLMFPPRDMYSPIEQQGVILSRTKHRDEARLFTGYLLDPGIQSYIAEDGYAVIEE